MRESYTGKNQGFRGQDGVKQARSWHWSGRKACPVLNPATNHIGSVNRTNRIDTSSIDSKQVKIK